MSLIFSLAPSTFVQKKVNWIKTKQAALGLKKFQVSKLKSGDQLCQNAIFYVDPDLFEYSNIRSPNLQLVNNSGSRNQQWFYQIY